ncbi:MAG: hypothetical protein JXD23_01515 [Spirochaetales bacterium]|nr:hypothetical protein [Spirochaetales bacterium]
MIFENRPLFQFRIFRVPVRFYASAALNLAFAIFYLSSPPLMLLAVVSIFVVIIAHELGHAAACALRRCRVLSIDVMFAGGTCSHDAAGSERDEIIIAWGGVAGQLVLAIAATSFYLLLDATVFPGNESARVVFTVITYQNVLAAVYNLIPLPGLDGARAWSFVTRRLRRSPEEDFNSSLRRVNRPPSPTRPFRKRESGVSAEAKEFADRMFEDLKQKQRENPDGN